MHEKVDWDPCHGIDRPLSSFWPWCPFLFVSIHILVNIYRFFSRLRLQYSLFTLVAFSTNDP